MFSTPSRSDVKATRFESIPYTIVSPAPQLAPSTEAPAPSLQIVKGVPPTIGTFLIVWSP